MKMYLKAILSICTILLLFYTLMDLNKQVRQYKIIKTELNSRYDSLLMVNDSLENEVFIKSTEVGRLEVVTNQVLSKYPKIYEEFNLYLDTQTE